MAALDDYSILARKYQYQSLHHEFSYSSECKLSDNRAVYSSNQQNFRRARSCDNILDGEWGGSEGCRNKRKEEVWGFRYGHHIGSTIDKRISRSSEHLRSSISSFEDKKGEWSKSGRPITSTEDDKKPKLREGKTPYEIFLEDDGPYSRRLFAPVTNKQPEERNTYNIFNRNKSQ